ncbi:histidine triad (HIT) protein [Micromonospora terminaliae]|uniref:Histidine triad (HIT) protein n=1 Tax=Micromonospora terminaliae TaxID=1914461 RepID=A0AAJ2ZIH0_9ACTN|nr:histidine triad (HIT) protein [Micromonospora terminaliae]NES30306.1 histidine triad (HIT) protein [Micromonospora terminaliae]QGL46934.1 histidine triad (HIT) protein [Micromonospora terminaliae]
MAEDCLICQKHRGEGALVGPLVWEDRDVIVTHRPAAEDSPTFLGYLFVETRRHAPSLDTLTESEAMAVARAVWVGARALRSELGPEFVFSAIVGRQVAHFHQHLFVRHPGTPAQHGWMDVDEWTGAPRGDAPRVAALCARLRGYFQPHAATLNT